MNAQTKPVAGSVRILVCNKCDAEFPVFDFEVESDADAIGLYSAGMCNGGLVLLELSFEEWRAAQSGDLKEIPPRLYNGIPIGCYQFAHILRVESPDLPVAGASFADFRREYRAPTIVYACPCCNDGEATSQREMTPEEFERSGGEITTLLPLTLVI